MMWHWDIRGALGGVWGRAVRALGSSWALPAGAVLREHPDTTGGALLSSPVSRCPPELCVLLLLRGKALVAPKHEGWGCFSSVKKVGFIPR